MKVLKLIHKSCQNLFSGERQGRWIRLSEQSVQASCGLSVVYVQPKACMNRMSRGRKKEENNELRGKIQEMLRLMNRKLVEAAEMQMSGTSSDCHLVAELQSRQSE